MFQSDLVEKTIEITNKSYVYLEILLEIYHAIVSLSDVTGFTPEQLQHQNSFTQIIGSLIRCSLLFMKPDLKKFNDLTVINRYRYGINQKLDDNNFIAQHSHIFLKYIQRIDDTKLKQDLLRNMIAFEGILLNYNNYFKSVKIGAQLYRSLDI